MKKKNGGLTDKEARNLAFERDRRSQDRILVDYEVDYRCGDNYIFAYITDISTMGIFIRTTHPHPPGTVLNLHFEPPNSLPIDVEGEVMWVNPDRPENPEAADPGMGIQFIDLDAKRTEIIARLVNTVAFLPDEDTTMGNS